MLFLLPTESAAVLWAVFWCCGWERTFLREGAEGKVGLTWGLLCSEGLWPTLVSILYLPTVGLGILSQCAEGKSRGSLNPVVFISVWSPSADPRGEYFPAE